MKKVLYVTNLPAPYRVAFFNLLARSVDLTVIYERERASDRDAKWKSEQISRDYREIWLSGIAVGRENKISAGIVQHLRKNCYDIILLSNYNSPAVILAILWLRRKGIPYGLNCDGMLPKGEQGRGPKEKLKRYLISGASFWFSTGKTTTRELCRYGANPKRVYEIPFSSISESEIPKTLPDRASCKAELGCGSRNVLLYVGQFIYRKGLDLLLPAFTRYREKFGDRDALLYLVGGTETQLLELCGSSLPENVRCVPFLTKQELDAYYNAADLFVLPTREDIWGLVVNEAMAHGVPVLTTDRCGAGLELIEPGINGLLVPAESVSELTEAIRMGLALPNAGKAAKNTALRYTVEAMADAAAQQILLKTGGWSDGRRNP